jgi:prepilin-type N-terminal cleavage/methylation domain-containing protein
MDRRGFTLIELLVVIAIIAILAAILFPVFARAREKARQTQCLSNVKEITLAFEMYKQDYDSFGPQRDITAGSIRLAWTDFLQPYIKNTQLFLCPSTQSPHSPWNTRVPTDYGYNFCRVRNTPESQIHRPAEYGATPASRTTASAAVVVLVVASVYETMAGGQLISLRTTRGSISATMTGTPSG